MSAEFVPPRVALVDLKTGMITREWYLLFRTLFTNSGLNDDEIQLIAPAANTDQALALLADFQSAALVAPIGSTSIMISIDEVLPVISRLSDEIASLRAALDDLKKGSLVI